jgi:hypothetical protein
VRSKTKRGDQGDRDDVLTSVGDGRERSNFEEGRTTEMAACGSVSIHRRCSGELPATGTIEGAAASHPRAPSGIALLRKPTSSTNQRRRKPWRTTPAATLCCTREGATARARGLGHAVHDGLASPFIGAQHTEAVARTPRMAAAPPCAPVALLLCGRAHMG